MKKILLTLVTILGLSQLVNAQFHTNDNYGRKTNINNLYKDFDKDGVVNYFDRNDRNSNVTFYKSNSYSTKSYPDYSNYNTPTYSVPSYRTIYTGSKGGQYYINSNGNKTYLKR